MEAGSLVLFVLGLLLLPLLAVLLMALCVRCRELPGEWVLVGCLGAQTHRQGSSPHAPTPLSLFNFRVAESPVLHHPLPSSPPFPASRALSSPGSYDTAASDGLTPSSIVIKPPPTAASWPPATSYPPVTYLLQSQPDLLRIPRSPQAPGGSPRMPSSQQDSDGANSVASYENEGASGAPAALVGRRLGPVLGSADPVSLPTPEAVCEDADEDEDEEDYPEGYLVVLPDNVPATGAAVPPAPASSNPGLRDSAFSMESGEDYVNVPESEESADASLDGSREYVNVSQELPPVARTEPGVCRGSRPEFPGGGG
ncbi:linker for activation of T-cells family member 1 isoform X4 [Lagenorhynchus albirostris]|uniref:linker for activation of T-cells family member 1 isoform X4 n=1 Tax=Lagenorhynchus albirostris TaxID=27610 RepID=UPI0028EDB559|nr:linker for activation of T-cells family member 1 isoform X4 [Lagenorhynchus albirostris]XP_059978223.1 linker for activation of T-cells family member 1 isoform X4 [Lagenorhynchus albirostris]XP_059978224.1 linker for activation of T-cells family member 1 isoform X4 [Lagenorhynchus albirostris]